MRRVMLRALPAIAASVFAGCATAPAQSPATVELTRLGEAVQMAENATSVQECEYVTDLSAPDSTTEGAVIELRNQAGSLGANTVLLVMGSDGSIARAEGYLCGD